MRLAVVTAPTDDAVDDASGGLDSGEGSTTATGVSSVRVDKEYFGVAAVNGLKLNLIKGLKRYLRDSTTLLMTGKSSFKPAVVVVATPVSEKVTARPSITIYKTLLYQPSHVVRLRTFVMLW